MKMLIPDFDFEKSKQHNLSTLFDLCEIFEEGSLFQKDWKEHLIKMFTFDALICNTDRHQDNWEILYFINDQKKLPN
jgi:hypothetical protein